ncbi:hypothetical protein ABZS66_35565 [Dactylosporangium sp. NPDC005572]|uniref:hypothetical protein n=1 Tax=Dactylosporangium sp. NPDC005572 TaxID=3156889 RepID=UPI00339F5429
MRRWVGAAGVGYVVLAGLENLDFLAVPGRGDPALPAYYAANPGGLRLSVLAGALALVAYALFAAGLWALLRPRPGAWLVLAAGIAGPLVAAASLPPRLRADHALHLDLRLAGGVLLGATLLGVAWAPGVLPRRLTSAAALVGAVLVPAGLLALLAGDPRLDALAFAGFVADAVWIGLAALWLLLPRPATWPQTVAWIVFFVVSVAAGVSGAALLAFPAGTRSFFAWPLGPPPLAATIGGCYLVATLLYGLALRAGGPARRWPEARGLLAGVVALSAPIFVVTLHHLEAFDFRVWQAWAWVVLFAVFPVAALVALRWGRPGPAPAGPFRMYRVAAAAYSALLAAAAGTLLAAPAVAARLPVAAGPFGARVLAGWFVLAAVLAAWVALRPPVETRLAALALPLFALVWLIAPLRGGAAWSPAWSTLTAALLLLGLLTLAGARGRAPARLRTVVAHHP